MLSYKGEYMKKIMQSCKNNWGIFIFSGITALICFIAIYIQGEVNLQQSLNSSGNLTFEYIGILIGEYGVSSTIAYGLLALSIALFSIGMTFYIQLSTENKINELLSEIKSIKNKRRIRVVKKT